VNLNIDIPGRPVPKARPRMVRGKIWTPTNKHENEVAKFMLQHRGAFAGMRDLALQAWFYGASPTADGDNLWKLVCDAAVKAQVIDDDRYIVCGTFEKRPVGNQGNPFPNKPGTRIRIGVWI